MASFKLGRCLLLDILSLKGLSQQQLADKVGMTKQQINNYASNRKKMSLSNAITIAAALNCGVHELYELISIKSEPFTKN